MFVIRQRNNFVNVVVKTYTQTASWIVRVERFIQVAGLLRPDTSRKKQNEEKGGRTSGEGFLTKSVSRNKFFFQDTKTRTLSASLKRVSYPGNE